jgi:serine/threonine protein kinase
MTIDDDPPTQPDVPRLGVTMPESDPATALVRRDGCIELPPGSIVDDIYEIDAKLGAGAMGEVYAARHVKLGKRVAIKVIGPRLSEDSAAIERFAMEARTLAQIQHPAIVAVDHVGELADGRAYFVMEYLKGESLFERLQRGRVPLPEALRILDQLARGLDAAHGGGIVHRDVKPENTFLVHLPGEPPLVKIVDFGLSTLRALDHRAERTESGVAIGTPMYMSPEQMRGHDVDYRTDVYALGVIAYELLLGCHPFERARTAPELYAAHLHQAPPLPRSIWPEIPPQLDLALFAMLAKDPAHRPTLAQIRSVIEGVRTSTPSQRAMTELVAPRAQQPKSMILVIVATTLIAGITIGAVLTRRETTRVVAPVIAPIDGGSASIVTQALTTLPTAPITTTPAPRVDVSGSGANRGNRHARPTPIGSAEIAAPILPDGGVDAAITIDAVPSAPPVMPEKITPRPIKPVDRNQTVNPFETKHKVSP